MIKFCTNYLCYEISQDGQNLSFIDLKTGKDRVLPGPCSKIVNHDRTETSAVGASFSDGILRVIFEDGTRMDLLVEEHESYLTFTMQAISREDFLAVGASGR